MSMHRREFLNTLAMASAAGLSLPSGLAGAQSSEAQAFYDVPKPGTASLLHYTDCHAQLLPIYFREPNVNLGVSLAFGKAPHLVGENLLKAFGIPSGSRAAHAFTHLEFEQAAKTYGKVGGFAHLSTLIKRLKTSRPGALLLDGGDTWQGSATALWSNGQDMVDAQKLLGVDVMTGHWEFTLGAKRVEEIIAKDFKGQIDFVAQNVQTTDFEDPVFSPYTIRKIGGADIAIIGQAFPYTPIANPRYFTPDWRFGIQEERLQKQVDEIRAKGISIVVLLSHNGMDVDLKLAGRVKGIDIILGGHTHDGVPAPTAVSNGGPTLGGNTLVTNAGSNGKFLGVVDFDVVAGRLSEIRYKLLPVFSNLLPADSAMHSLIEKHRAPYAAKLAEPLATTQSLLYRRGNFNGSFDQLILNGLMKVKDTPIAFSPGFRWGTSLLPGQTITREHLMDQTAITYPSVTVSELSGEMIKTILEDVADNLFNPDPYLQQGGDMVRVGGLQYDIDPIAKAGSRISNMRLKGELLDVSKTYKVAGWAPVSEQYKTAPTEPIWDVMEAYLKSEKNVSVGKLNLPNLRNVQGNLGLAQ
jgi:S-sulfosulfanyl-L-cysteine sulfohydrolase